MGSIPHLIERRNTKDDKGKLTLQLTGMGKVIPHYSSFLIALFKRE